MTTAPPGMQAAVLACVHCGLDMALHFAAGLRPWGDTLNPRYLSVPSQEELRERLPLNFSTFGYNYVMLVFLLCIPGMLRSLTFILLFVLCASLWYVYSLHVEPQVTPIGAYLALTAGSLTLTAILCGNCLGLWCVGAAAALVLTHASLHERGSYRTLPGDTDEDV